MSRSRRRVCLQDGQRLDINRLLRDGTMPHPDEKAGSLRVRFPDGFAQDIRFASRPRHFGGRQFFFECPATGRLASVLWKPPGATRFCSRHAWRGQIAYRSQFMDPTGRAHLAKAQIRAKLSCPEWWDDMPGKPKWQRWATYARWEVRYEAQEANLDKALLARLG